MAVKLRIAEQHCALMQQELFDCYVASGADPSGMDGPHHLNPGEALAAVRELRTDADDTTDLDRADRLGAENERLRGALEWCRRNFDGLLAGHPVRDVAEMRAQIAAALAASREGER